MNVLELNDAGLLLSDGEQILLESPGFAALEGKELLVGAAARARSRIDPRRTQSRYWYQLEAGLATPFGPARSHADLAYAQLQALRETSGDEPLILAAPGSFTREQLGLLLGIVEAVQLKAIGLVDAAVAAASTVETDARAVHLDVQLHRFVLSVLDGGAELKRLRVEEVAKPGLNAVWDAAAKAAAQAFVQQTRFDPLHTASTEQTLFDALPAWLQALSAEANAMLELSVGDRRHRASVARGELVARLAERYDSIARAIEAEARPRPATLLLSARAAAVPGLAEYLERATGLAPVALDPLAVARGAIAQSARIASDGPGLAHVTRLAGRPRQARASTLSEATHVLFNDRATPLPQSERDAPLPLSQWLGDAPAALRRLDGRLWLDGGAHAGLLVNGRAAQLPLRMSLGDRIEFGGSVIRLIEVLQ